VFEQISDNLSFGDIILRYEFFRNRIARRCALWEECSGGAITGFTHVMDQAMAEHGRTSNSR
jgi:hypothetical protein